MIELLHIGPGLDRVAGFAAERLAIRTELRHSIAELALVRIGVATGASQIFKAIGGGPRRRLRLCRGVTFRARHGEMRTGQRVTALLVLRDRERGWLEGRNRVARFALTREGRLRELSLVHIRVTIGATGECDFVARGRARGRVAFRARNGGVASFERVSSDRVLLDAKP